MMGFDREQNRRTSSYHILTSSVIHYWTDARQLGIYLLNIYIFLRVFDIANQLLARHSPIAPLGQVDEWTAKCSTFSIHGRLWDFFGLWLLKHWKTRIAYRYWRSKTKIRKEKPKVTYSVALVIALLPAENENQQLTDLPQVDFVLTVGTNNITENLYIGS